MEQCTLFVLSSQYVLKNIWVLAPFDPSFWLMAPFNFESGPFLIHLGVVVPLPASYDCDRYVNIWRLL
jgi:hypothetical protein